MKLERAQRIVDDLLENSKRWGAKNYGTGQFSTTEIVLAFVMIIDHMREQHREEIDNIKQEHAKKNRQAAAAAARAAKNTKKDK